MRCITPTHGSFSESFFPVFNWRYFLFHHSPLWASKYHFAILWFLFRSYKFFAFYQISLCKFHKNSLRERLLEGKAVTLWDELTEHKTVSQKASFQFLTEDISFSPLPFVSFQISLCKFQNNSLSEKLLEGKAVTMWDELTEHKAVSQKSSFQFITEDVSFFTTTLYGFLNINMQISQEQS